MSKSLIALLIILSRISCSSDNDCMDELVENQDNFEEIKGNFVSDAQTTSGMVSVNEEGTVLNLKNFKN